LVAGAGWVSKLSQALQERTTPSFLEKFHMSCCITVEGLEALRQAIEGGACPYLTRLHIDAYRSQEVMIATITDSSTTTTTTTIMGDGRKDRDDVSAIREAIEGLSAYLQLREGGLSGDFSSSLVGVPPSSSSSLSIIGPVSLAPIIRSS